MILQQWTSIVSSNLAAMKYDAPAQTLSVRFKSGATYDYADVAPEEAENLFHASSPGKYFNDAIKGNYEEKRVG